MRDLTVRKSAAADRRGVRSVCRQIPESLEQRRLLSAAATFVETNLVSDIPGVAPHTDSVVVNPWGFTETPGGQFQLSDNGTGTAATFAADGTPLGAPIIIPPPPGSPAGTTSTPNGQLDNTTSDFVISEGGRSAPATVIFSTEDGTIAGFNPAVDPFKAIIAVNQSASGAVYKLVTMASAGGVNYLYASNFHNGTVDVFDKNFAPHTFFAKQFVDPKAPAGFAPFGVKDVNGVIFVTYAKQDADKHDDVAGAGNGFIDEFDTTGHFLKRFASGTAAGGTLTTLDSPIGAAFAPAGFGNFGGDLLIGNFGDSHVSAFNPKTGKFLGELLGANGKPLVLNGGVNSPPHDTKGLWGIAFGNGHGGAAANALFFASGPNDESDGVFGKVTMARRNDGDNDGDDDGDRAAMSSLSRSANTSDDDANDNGDQTSGSDDNDGDGLDRLTRGRDHHRRRNDGDR